jgi:hypothetical protein
MASGALAAWPFLPCASSELPFLAEPSDHMERIARLLPRLVSLELQTTVAGLWLSM